ncbi:MAG: 2TM domain-containing protein [Flavobacteriaceae bacterium]|nr:2TM domain-containing protein [Flavobacteriaceae bacterium]
MFGNSKKEKTNIDPEQYEMMKRAEKRIKTKKGLYNHFVFFVLGAALMIVLNKIFHYGEDIYKDWSILATTIWGFFVLFHLVRVYIIKRFLGKEWEAEQMKKLVGLQRDRIEKIKKNLVKEEQLMAQSELYNEHIQSESQASTETPQTENEE